jgi:hypothetical protein
MEMLILTIIVTNVEIKGTSQIVVPMGEPNIDFCNLFE